MFQSKHVPCYLDGLNIRQEKLKGDDYKIADLLFRIEPMSPSLAGEISESVKSTLFRRVDGEVVSHLRAIGFDEKDLVLKPQAIEFRGDPKIAKPAFEIGEGRIAKLRARKPKDGRQWIFFFTVSCTELDGKTLLAMTEGLYKQWFLSFENALRGLFDVEEDEARRAESAPEPVDETPRKPRRRRKAAEEDAPATDTTEGVPLH